MEPRQIIFFFLFYVGKRVSNVEILNHKLSSFILCTRNSTRSRLSKEVKTSRGREIPLSPAPSAAFFSFVRSAQIMIWFQILPTSVYFSWLAISALPIL